MTKGEYRVGINFNPSNDDVVGRIKRLAADLIDLIETIPVDVESNNMYVEEHIRLVEERIRLKALAQTHIEDGAMWGVKAATKGNPDK